MGAQYIIAVKDDFELPRPIDFYNGIFRSLNNWNTRQFYPENVDRFNSLGPSGIVVSAAIEYVGNCGIIVTPECMVQLSFSRPPKPDDSIVTEALLKRSLHYETRHSKYSFRNTEKSEVIDFHGGSHIFMMHTDNTGRNELAGALNQLQTLILGGTLSRLHTCLDNTLRFETKDLCYLGYVPNKKTGYIQIDNYQNFISLMPGRRLNFKKDQEPWLMVAESLGMQLSLKKEIQSPSP